MWGFKNFLCILELFEFSANYLEFCCILKFAKSFNKMQISNIQEIGNLNKVAFKHEPPNQ